jgi:hypothetical protein
MSCPAYTVSEERTACPPRAGDSHAGGFECFRESRTCLYRSGGKSLSTKHHCIDQSRRHRSFDLALNRHEPKQLPLNCPAGNCPLDRKVLAPNGDDMNLSKTGGNLDDDRIIQILSAFICRFWGRILVTPMTATPRFLLASFALLVRNLKQRRSNHYDAIFACNEGLTQRAEANRRLACVYILKLTKTVSVTAMLALGGGRSA